MPDSQKRCRQLKRESVRTATEVFDVLSDGDRRYVLHYLHRYSNRADLDDLIEFVLDMAPDRGPGDRNHVAMSLHHNHLPKLAHHGLIEYDPRDGTVVYAGNPLAEACLEHAAALDLRELRN